jgi:hypothetical protein
MRPFRFDATVWEHDGAAAWHFVSLPSADADAIEDAHGRQSGFGSIRVAARIGSTSWSTSIFPDAKRGTFVLPVKKTVRDQEGLTDGSAVTVELEVLD